MQFRVGQRIRLLHDTGEGVVVRLLDRDHVEVDLGQEFTVDVHVDEIIPVSNAEGRFFQTKEDEEKAHEKRAESLKKLGVSILDVSLAIVHSEDQHYEGYLVNPEPADIVFTCYLKARGKYTGIGAGKLPSGEARKLFGLDQAEFAEAKGFYFQVLPFVTGKSYPHTPLQREIPFTRNSLASPAIYVQALRREGWIFSLRTDPQVADIKAIEETEFVRIRQEETPVRRPDPELDLHIEALVRNPATLKPGEILDFQLRRLEQALSDAVIFNYAGLTVIHGIGEGKLKAAVHELLKKTRHVKQFHAADPTRYGAGATRVLFR
ncbi:MAG: Smr/MutS family protein [Bacteroidia bacterium]|nr:Smr/MutS family protein [Bacteroidia bacterium]